MSVNREGLDILLPKSLHQAHPELSRARGCLLALGSYPNGKALNPLHFWGVDDSCKVERVLKYVTVSDHHHDLRCFLSGAAAWNEDVVS